jgi:hypothetical protein
MSALMIYAELEQVRAASADGMLRPADVVKFAEDPATELHKRFAWDDTEAARRYRLDQARGIIRTTITVLPRANRVVDAYVSLVSDRTNANGYRAMVDVLADDTLRAELLNQALKELDRVRSKYERLVELAPVFEAMEQIAARTA